MGCVLLVVVGLVFFVLGVVVQVLVNYVLVWSDNFVGIVILGGVFVFDIFKWWYWMQVMFNGMQQVVNIMFDGVGNFNIVNMVVLLLGLYFGGGVISKQIFWYGYYQVMV